jgi:hypothetical protein
MKELSIKLSDYIEYKRPNYMFLKLIPSNSIRNYNSDKILSLIAGLYRSIDKQIRTTNNKLFFECNAKISYYIYIEKTKVEFYFIVPETHFNLYKDKIIDVWQNKITIVVVPEIPLFNNECTKFYMTYKKEDAMSLSCDKRNNVLLNSLLTKVHIMEEGDKVGVFYNFAPTYQKNWRVKYDKTITKLKDDLPISKNKLNALYIANMLLLYISKLCDVILDALSFGNKKVVEVKKIKDLYLSDDTRRKRDEQIIDTQILCFSYSECKSREYNNALSICESYECLDNDNRIVFKKYKGSKVNMFDTRIKNAEVFKVQPREGQNFISLPGRELLEEHKIIQHTDVLESEIPNELRTGIICIGENTYKGTISRAFLPTGKNERNLSLIIIGPTRSGKSTLISNISNDARKGGECTIIFDFCANCELSDSVCNDVGNVLNVDCSDFDKLQGLGYNEADISISKISAMEQYKNAKIKTTQLITLIDSVNSDDRDLKAKMNKFLTAAALVVFISNGSVKDVFMVLQDYKIRHYYISKITNEYLEFYDEYINVLNELDDMDNKKKVVGTKYNTAIIGIMDRVGQLKQNTYMELMLKKDCKNNFNLIEEIQKNQIICFRMPEHMFTNESEKDPYCTYWMSKIWLAVKMRNAYIPKEEHVKLNVIIDELSQVPHCEEFVRSKLSQMAKFNCKMIFSCHYLNQIKIIREELKSASATYMLISGCNKDNYKELKEELDPYTLDDVLRLKKHYSLNLVKADEGYVKFVTKLPKPL